MDWYDAFMVLLAFVVLLGSWLLARHLDRYRDRYRDRDRGYD